MSARHAILIGINDYPPGSGLAPLRFAEADARHLADHLRRRGYGIHLLAGPDATRDRIEETVAARGRGDVCLFFFAGHGQLIHGRYYLHPINSKAGGLRAIPFAFFQEHWQDPQFGYAKVLALLDACRSEAMGIRGQRGFSADEARDVRAATHGARWVEVLYGCAEREVSYEDPALGHGVFTHALVQALEAQTGLVDSDYLAGETADRMLEWSERDPQGRQQVAHRYAVPSRRNKIILVGDEAGGVRPETVGSPGPQPPPHPPPRPERTGTFPGIAPPRATKEQPWENSLGMRFVPVPVCPPRIRGRAASVKDLGLEIVPVSRPEVTDRGARVTVVFVPAPGTEVLFNVWETRVQDYEAFVKATGRAWGKAGPKQGPTHPAVNVSWEDAQAFCGWLTESERKAGRLASGWQYRLPTDGEWSWAVGIGDRETGRTPQEKSMKLKDVYPWGTAWPPPNGAGNYADESWKRAYKDATIIAGYDDGYACTSPVGSFAANGLGLYDLGGNVWEWCEDFFNGKDGERALRGGSWLSGDPVYLLSSYRLIVTPDSRRGNCGFRVVLGEDSAR